MDLKLAETIQALKQSRIQEIPPPAEEQLQVIKEQIRRLDERIKKQHEKSSMAGEKSRQQQAFEKGHLALLFDQMYRIKRFLMLYHTFRCDRIEDQFWEFAGDLKHSEKGNLTETEKKYYGSYKALVMEAMEESGVELTSDLDPPLHYQVDYHMLEDCGEILDEQGQPIRLEKNSRGFIRKKLIEKYLRQGQAELKKK